MVVLLGVCEGARMVMSEKIAEERRALKVESTVDSSATETTAETAHTHALQKEEESEASDLFPFFRDVVQDHNRRNGRPYDEDCEEEAQRSVRGGLQMVGG